MRGEEQIDMMISAASELDLSGAMENLNYLSEIRGAPSVGMGFIKMILVINNAFSC